MVTNNEPKSKSLYKILEVDFGASNEVIKAAYRALQKKHHPDHGGDIGLSKKINKAYEVLSNTQKKDQYDQIQLKKIPNSLGPYKIIKEIGEGGFGRTYKAEHKLLGGFACLKQNLDISPEHEKIMYREARLLWDVHHHSLPTLRDFFKHGDGEFVFAMSFVEGPTLDQIVQKSGGIEPEHVSWMTQRLLNALHYLHFNGIVHCDIKPNNIIIKPDEHNAVLVDYGFSSLKPTNFSKVDGYTPIFAAPELVFGKPPLPQTDLYSLALTMIYALGGNPLTKTYPKGTPPELKSFFNSFLDDNPLKRDCWEKGDLVKKLSTIRKDIFGRSVSNKKFTW